MTRKKLGTLALCLMAGLGLFACGGSDEVTVETSSGKATSAEAARDKEGPKDDPKPTPAAGTTKRTTEPKKAKTSASREMKTKQKPSSESPGEDEESSRELTDEERCEREPSSCRPKEVPPDYSNPDVRRAEERAKEPDEPTKCDSSDCAELRKDED